MKNIYVISLLLLTLCSFADTYYTETIADGCDEIILKSDTGNSRLVAVFQRNQYTCSNGYYLPANSVNCIACPSGETCNGGTFYFDERKNQGIKYTTPFTTTKSDACVTNFLESDTGNSRLVAVFQRNQYTCSNGYYLPAGSTNCVACPSGETCNGGTFYFDERKNQGIKYTTPFTTTKSDACVTNFLESDTGNSRIVAVFVPNTINLNYDDGNGNTTAMTCDYGGTINIPETAPTRPGYVFTGWVVRQNEQSNE